MAFGAWGKKVSQGPRKLLSQLGAPVAIDFGSGALKLLQITGDERPALVAAACLPTPDELLSQPAKRLAFQVEALPKLVRACGFRGRRAVCAIPAGQTFCKHMQFQPVENTPMSTLVRAAVPAQLNCDPGALVYRHVEVGPVARGSGAGKTEVICMAASRELVERLMQAIKAARLDPVGMHSEFVATIRAFDSITRRAEDEKLTSLYLDVGAGSTKAMIAHGRNLVFARSIDLGGRHLDEAIVRQTKIDLTEARRQRLDMADFARPIPGTSPSPARPTSADRPSDGSEPSPEAAPPGAAVAEDRRVGRVAPGLTPDLSRQPSRIWSPPRADLTEPLEILTDEVSMCLRYHEERFPDRRVDRAIFVGGEARHLGLCQHIAKALRLPAQVADPLASVARTGNESTPGVDLGRAQPGWAMALGLCLCPTDL